MFSTTLEPVTLGIVLGGWLWCDRQYKKEVVGNEIKNVVLFFGLPNPSYYKRQNGNSEVRVLFAMRGLYTGSASQRK